MRLHGRVSTRGGVPLPLQPNGRAAGACPKPSPWLALSLVLTLTVALSLTVALTVALTLAVTLAVTLALALALALPLALDASREPAQTIVLLLARVGA